MKKMILSLLLLVATFYGYAKTWTVTGGNMFFNPSTLTINQGDSVKFTMDGSHNALEVSQSTWNANGTTSNGGFSVPFGGGTALPAKLTVGTHYYVCVPHATYGMKAKIVVQAATALSEISAEPELKVFSNPNGPAFSIQLTTAEPNPVEISIYDLQGSLVQILLPKTAVEGFFERAFERPAQLAPGMYLIRSQVGNRTVFSKVML